MRSSRYGTHPDLDFDSNMATLHSRIEQFGIHDWERAVAFQHPTSVGGERLDVSTDGPTATSMGGFNGDDVSELL